MIITTRSISRIPIIFILLLSACVDPIYFDVPPAGFLTVVEGMINEGPGPFTVSVSKGINVNQDTLVRSPYSGVDITLYDDEGHEEKFHETSVAGTYRTSGLISGRPGHSYFIRIVTPEGNEFVSEPETILPVGEVEQIRFEFEARTIETSFGEIPNNVFNIYVDANAGTDPSALVRWRFTGTYLITNNPELYMRHEPPYTPYKDPWPCSGYVVEPGPEGSGGLLAQVGDCVCCTCWIKQHEPFPQILDQQLISNGRFQHVKVGEVPVNDETFFEKYMVEVEQMSLSKNAYDFFRLIRQQKKDAAGLFQSIPSEIRGNIKSTSGNQPVVGLFWATSIRTKVAFIYPKDVPYLIPPRAINTRACTDSPDSSNEKPSNWE